MGEIAAVVLDLDGVVRHFAPDHEATLCRDAGLEPGTIEATAFAPDLIGLVVTGAITKAEWLARVGEAIGAVEAAVAWGRTPATIDQGVLAIVDEVRATGRPATILTNGTDAVPAELAALDVAHRFDRIFNSAEIGHAKPDVRAFAHVCEALDLAPERVAFTDDSRSKLTGAATLGMPTHPFTSAAALRDWLVDLAVLPS